MLRALCTWQRWIGVWLPNVRRDRLGQCLGAVDDEQAADRRVQAAPNQIVEQRLHGGSTFGGALDRAKRMLAPLRVDPDRRHQQQLLLYMDAVDLDRQQV